MTQALINRPQSHFLPRQIIHNTYIGFDVTDVLEVWRPNWQTGEIRIRGKSWKCVKSIPDKWIMTTPYSHTGSVILHTKKKKKKNTAQNQRPHLSIMDPCLASYIRKYVCWQSNAKNSLNTATPHTSLEKNNSEKHIQTTANYKPHWM